MAVAARQGLRLRQTETSIWSPKRKKKFAVIVSAGYGKTTGGFVENEWKNAVFLLQCQV